MEFKLFGLNLRLEVVVLLLIVGAILGSHLLCSCSRVSVAEGMTLLGASLDYKTGEGVRGSWDTRPMPKETQHSLVDTSESKLVTPNESMVFLADTQFKPGCCDISNYSTNGGLTGQGVSSGGCACLNKSQMDYLNTRGGNRTLPSEF